MTKPMTTKQALAERARLRLERERALGARAQHSTRARAIAAELKPIPLERKAMLRAAARSGEAPDVDALDRREGELRREREAEAEAAKAANDAAKQAEKELLALHFDQLGAFASAAENLVQEAAEKLAALRESYVAAYEAGEKAREEWTLLVNDFNRQLIDRSGPAERSSGEIRKRQLSPPPAGPLAPPGRVFSAAPIRPPEVEPVEGAA